MAPLLSFFSGAEGQQMVAAPDIARPGAGSVPQSTRSGQTIPSWEPH